MKLFIRKTLLFTIPVLFIFQIKPFYLMVDGKYENNVEGSEIYLSIRKSKEKSNKKILVIGDSVGYQLFEDSKESNDSINSLACNQAIGVIGQFFLLNNYLKAGNKPQEVYMIYTPFSFTNNLNQVYTFHYFLKPFYKKEYQPLFSERTINQINKVPFSSFCRVPNILTSNWSPKFKSTDSVNYKFLSPISKEYIERIKVLCTNHDINFYLIPTPTKESNKNKVLNFNSNEFSNLLVEDEFKYFINNIKYLPDSLYKDNVHLKEPKKLIDFVINEMKKAQTSKNIYSK